jgi:hypothetical protein
MEAEMFGWRTAVLLILGLAVLYLLFTLYRLIRVGKRPASRQEPTPARAEAVPYASNNLPELTETVPESAAISRPEWRDVVDLELLDVIPQSVPVREAQPPRMAGFGEQLAEHLARSDLEREVRSLRAEIDALRAEIEEIKAARNISPHYTDALALSQRGLSAQDVAARLGISLAEAELVHALSRGEQIFEEGEDDGADRDERDAGGERYEPGFGSAPRRDG